jgi:hypothetical protein
VRPAGVRTGPLTRWAVVPPASVHRERGRGRVAGRGGTTPSCTIRPGTRGGHAREVVAVLAGHGEAEHSRGRGVQGAEAVRHPMVLSVKPLSR